ncbi:MAG: antibiotic biosynthesis monooxygenase [Dyella sp.]
MSHAVDVVAIISTTPEHIERVAAAVSAAVPHVLAEDGCERYEFYLDLPKSRLFAVERWRDAAALDVHAKAPALTVLSEAIAGLATVEVNRITPLR